jgi:GNAT superfamily N-acetyltransferase
VSIKIRSSLEREDWRFIREVCCLTGKGGDPIAVERRPFFAEEWVGPYEKLRPEYGYVAEMGGVKMGYLTGCPETSVFQKEKKWLFDLPLFLRAKFGGFTKNGDRDRFVDRFLGKSLGPEDCFPKEITRAVLDEFPAHLHMNLIAAARGRGIGRALIERYRRDLAEEGVPGIHLYCGKEPLPFYQSVGFRLLDQIEFRPGVIVYRLGSRTKSG